MVKKFWSDWIRFVLNGSKLDSSLVTLIIGFLTIIYSSLFIIFLINSLQWVFFNLFENKQYFNLFLARDQRKLLTCFSRNPYPKFPTFSMFYQFWIFFINLLDHFSNNCHFFGSYWIRSVQNGSKRIKLDQMEVLTNQKLLL